MDSQPDAVDAPAEAGPIDGASDAAAPLDTAPGHDAGTDVAPNLDGGAGTDAGALLPWSEVHPCSVFTKSFGTTAALAPGGTTFALGGFAPGIFRFEQRRGCRSSAAWPIRVRRERRLLARRQAPRRRKQLGGVLFRDR